MDNQDTIKIPAEVETGGIDVAPTMYSTRGATTIQSLSARVGQRIRKARRELQLTQVELAEPEFSTSYISSIERGKIHPSLTALSILAQKLNLPVAHFLSIDDAEDEADALVSTAWNEHALVAATIALYQQEYAQVAQLLSTRTLSAFASEERITAHLLLARALLAERNLLGATAEAEQAQREAQHLQDSERIARAQALLAQLAFQQHKLPLALSLYQECLAALPASLIHTESTSPQDQDPLVVYDPLFVVEALTGAGRCAAALGNHTQALSYYSQALIYLPVSAKDRLLAAEFWKMSRHAQQMKNLAVASHYAYKSLALYEAAQLRQGLAAVLTNSGHSLRELNQNEAAQEKLEQAYTYAKQTANRENEVLAAAALAELLLKEKGAKEAKKWAQEAASEAAELTSYARGMVAVALGQVATASNNLAEARKQFQLAAELLEEAQATEELSRCSYLFGELLSTTGQAAEAAKWFKKAYLIQQDPSPVGAIRGLGQEG